MVVSSTQFSNKKLGFLVAQQWRVHLQCRRHRFDPSVGKIPWRRKWQPTPVFLPGESPWTEEPGRLQSMVLQGVRQDWSDLAHIFDTTLPLTFHPATITGTISFLNVFKLQPMSSAVQYNIVAASYQRLFFKNWSRVTLWYCVSFRCTAKWFNYICVIYFRLFSIIGYYKVLSIIPFVIW